MTRRPLLQAFLGTLATNGVIILTGMATGILAARLLGPEQRGALTVLMFWPGLLAGIGLLSLNEAAIYRRNATAASPARFVSTLFWLSLALAALVAAPAALALPFLLGQERAGLLPVARLYLLLFLPFNFLALALLAVDQADLRFRRFNLLRILPSATYLVAMLVLWFAGSISAVTFLWASWLGTLLTALLRAGMRWRELWHLPDPREARALIGRASAFHVTALIGILGSQMDRLLVVRLFEDAEIGLYVVALTLAATAVNGLGTAVSTVLFPAIAAGTDRAAALRRLAAAMRQMVLVTGLCVLALAGALPWLLPLLFGKAFAAAVPIAILLSFAFGPLALRQILVRSLRAFGAARAGTISEAVTVALFFLLSWPAVAMLGLAGVPIALLGANLVGLWVIGLRLKSHYQLRWRRWLWPGSEWRDHLRALVSLVVARRVVP